VGPLIAWRRASVSNLRRQFTAPAFGGLLVGAALLGLGMRNFYALVCYTLSGFVMTTILQEFYKGVGARMRMHGENPLAALFRLVARNRRRYGGYVVHLGIVVMFAAFGGLAFKKEFDITLRPGETFSATDPWGHRWSFTSQGVSEFEQLNRQVQAIGLVTTRDGRPMPLLTSERRQHVDSQGNPTFEPSTEVGIMGSLRQDVYLVLSGVSPGEQAEVRVSFNPLVEWVWYGGMIMALGGLVVMWPQAERARKQGGYQAELRPAREREAELAGAGL
jgi:cytochrome c-type biogenesis protein CcmF